MNTIFKSPLSKMITQFEHPIAYYLGDCSLNVLLGKSISLHYLNEIYCTQCQRKTNKSFQGFCFSCFKRLEECNFCIIHPERCKHPEGKCLPDDWVHASCGVQHVVYLSNTAHIKVGITRKTQIPTRWIDQGAIQAIPLFETHNRYLAGQIEVVCKQFFPDKTPWQAMLKNQVQPQNLIQIREQFFLKEKNAITELIKKMGEPSMIISEADHMADIMYPVIQYPAKVNALNFHKTPKIEGTLLGIKGQYLLLDVGVLNIRKFSGYLVEIGLRE